MLVFYKISYVFKNSDIKRLVHITILYPDSKNLTSLYQKPISMHVNMTFISISHNAQFYYHSKFYFITTISNISRAHQIFKICPNKLTFAMLSKRKRFNIKICKGDTNLYVNSRPV